MEICLKFHSIDFWSRPVYEWEDKGIYFGSTDSLFPDKEKAPNNTIKEINEYFRNNIDQIVYFGTELDADPNGGVSSKWKFKIED